MQAIEITELVKQYKNKTPVISYEERVQIVEAIKYVDRVVPQTHRDKFAAWQEHKFDRMFVGDDWKGSPLFNELEEKFKPLGVEIIYFPYTTGTSSTLLKKTLAELTK